MTRIEPSGKPRRGLRGAWWIALAVGLFFVAVAVLQLTEVQRSRQEPRIGDGENPETYGYDLASLTVKRRWLAAEISRLGDRPTAVMLALAEKLAAGKAQLPDALAWLLSWYRDLLVYPDQPEQVLNRDLDRELHQAVTGADRQARLDGMQAIYRALKALQQNANPRLTMESLVLQLAALQGPRAK